MYTSELISKYVIAYCNEMGIFINGQKLNYIMYLLQSQSLIRTNKKLFLQDIIVKQNGPQVKNLEYKLNDIEPIITQNVAMHMQISREDQYFIDDIIERCNKYSIKGLWLLIVGSDGFKNAQTNGINKSITSENLRLCANLCK